MREPLSHDGTGNVAPEAGLRWDSRATSARGRRGCRSLLNNWHRVGADGHTQEIGRDLEWSVGGGW